MSTDAGIMREWGFVFAMCGDTWLSMIPHTKSHRQKITIELTDSQNREEKNASRLPFGIEKKDSPSLSPSAPEKRMTEISMTP